MMLYIHIYIDIFMFINELIYVCIYMYARVKTYKNRINV